MFNVTGYLFKLPKLPVSCISNQFFANTIVLSYCSKIEEDGEVVLTEENLKRLKTEFRLGSEEVTDFRTQEQSIYIPEKSLPKALDSGKLVELFKLHKEDPEVWSPEALALKFSIPQRHVEAIMNYTTLPYIANNKTASWDKPQFTDSVPYIGVK